MDKKEMTIAKLFLMTLLPSAISTALYLLTGVLWQGVPSIALIFIVLFPTLMAFELCTVLSANRKEYGKYGFKVVFSKCEKINLWVIILYGFILFGFAGLMSITVASLENMLTAGASEKLYSLLPAYFDWNNFELMKEYGKDILIFTSVFYLLMNVIICPVIEEIYFRGYLTDRLNRYGILAPILVTVAFSFYHWWLPFGNIFRICIFGVASLITYKKKNIYISIVFHCLCNLFSTISFIAVLLG